ncbi:MAG: AMP-binding protein, partial [Pseudomonadota bacterium]
MSNFLYDGLMSGVVPARHFLHLIDGSHWTYSDLDQQTAQIAHALVVSGVEAGDRVMAQVPKSPQALALYLACIRAGAVFLPLNTAYTAKELDYFLEDAEPRLLVTDSAVNNALACANLT